VAHACILATQEAEIRRIMVQSQLGQIVRKTQSRKKPITKKRVGKVAQDVGSEFKPQYHKKKKKKKKVRDGLIDPQCADGETEATDLVAIWVLLVNLNFSSYCLHS
jgi:hypothetical protein